MSLMLERIEALAPDQASLAAARKLLKPSSWPTLAQAAGLVWGECQDSGATPYRVVVNEADAGYKCTCRSSGRICRQYGVVLLIVRLKRKRDAFLPLLEHAVAYLNEFRVRFNVGVQFL